MFVWWSGDGFEAVELKLEPLEAILRLRHDKREGLAKEGLDLKAAENLTEIFAAGLARRAGFFLDPPYLVPGEGPHSIAEQLAPLPVYTMILNILGQLPAVEFPAETPSVCATCWAVFHPRRKRFAKRCPSCTARTPSLPLRPDMKDLRGNKTMRVPMMDPETGVIGGWRSGRLARCAECRAFFITLRKPGEQVFHSEACRKKYGRRA